MTAAVYTQCVYTPPGFNIIILNRSQTWLKLMIATGIILQGMNFN